CSTPAASAECNFARLAHRADLQPTSPAGPCGPMSLRARGLCPVCCHACVLGALHRRRRIHRFMTMSNVHGDDIVPQRPEVLLSGFADEAANDKKLEQQFAALAALGLSYYSIRFVDVGNGVKNVMQLDSAELDRVKSLQRDYGLQVATLGSPIGKVKLLDVDDGTTNRFVPFDRYLAEDVQRACDLAHTLGTRLIRGFSFYHPKGSRPEDHLSQVVDQLGAITETCDRQQLTFGLEVEANLVGQTGELLAEIHRRVNHPALVLIFDA